MKEKRIRHLPVIGADGSLLGVLSDRDVLRALNPEHPLFNKNCLVVDFMSWPAKTIEQESSLADALQFMISEKISCLFVKKAGVIMGLVTSEDFLKLLQRLLQESGPNRKPTLHDLAFDPVVDGVIRAAGSLGI